MVVVHQSAEEHKKRMTPLQNSMLYQPDIPGVYSENYCACPNLKASCRFYAGIGRVFGLVIRTIER